jgi:formate hydrogenlyase subunit 3/multisubunit Na+/H+ antiporter MnhD subunit
VPDSKEEIVTVLAVLLPVLVGGLVVPHRYVYVSGWVPEGGVQLILAVDRFTFFMPIELIALGLVMVLRVLEEMDRPALLLAWTKNKVEVFAFRLVRIVEGPSVVNELTRGWDCP